MAVIITDMDMPKSCEVCKFSSYHDGDDYCDLYKIMYGYAWRAKDVKWDDDCPLKSADDYKPILDKIRAEIEFEVDHRTNMLCAEDVFAILDKYKAKSEDRE